jgi:hypothetical protein
LALTGLKLVGVAALDGDEPPPPPVDFPEDFWLLFTAAVFLELEPLLVLVGDEWDRLVAVISGGEVEDEFLPRAKKPTPRTTAMAPAPTTIAERGRLRLPVE